MSNDVKYKLIGEFLWCCVFFAILIAIVFTWQMVLENGQYHHDSRVENVVGLLAGYEDCEVFSLTENEGSLRAGSDIIVLNCVK